MICGFIRMDSDDSFVWLECSFRKLTGGSVVIQSVVCGSCALEALKAAGVRECEADRKADRGKR
jgi:hypothetical protein